MQFQKKTLTTKKNWDFLTSPNPKKEKKKKFFAYFDLAKFLLGWILATWFVFSLVSAAIAAFAALLFLRSFFGLAPAVATSAFNFGLDLVAGELFEASKLVEFRPLLVGAGPVLRRCWWCCGLSTPFELLLILRWFLALAILFASDLLNTGLASSFIFKLLFDFEVRVSFRDACCWPPPPSFAKSLLCFEFLDEADLLDAPVLLLLIPLDEFEFRLFCWVGGMGTVVLSTGAMLPLLLFCTLLFVLITVVWSLVVMGAGG